MTDPTALDTAHAAMSAAPEDDAARLRFYARLAEAELFVLLEREAEGEVLSPRLFDLADGPVVLVFDREERLAAFTGAPAPYAALPGRVVARMLGGQGIGLGLNLEVAPSALLLPPAAVDWLAGMLGQVPEERADRMALLAALERSGASWAVSTWPGSLHELADAASAAGLVLDK